MRERDHYEEPGSEKESPENRYFNEALQNFTREFAYAGAIRHLVDRGYDTERIIKEMKYPLKRDVIEKMVERARNENSQRIIKFN
ncbi:MAG: hypothetical protein IJR19_05290 [Lachnospiraceae bacterium]|nr:hypothetical protein [Lachnospiraceae bacterium]